MSESGPRALANARVIAMAIGAWLESHDLVGERALLLYPAGLEFIAAFLGCLYAGVVAVPAYPPDPSRLARTLPRLQAIIRDSQASVVLTTQEILSMAEFLFSQAPELAALKWVASDSIPGERASTCVACDLAETRRTVVFGEGKTPDQVAAIAERIVGAGRSLLVTRTTRAAFEAVSARLPEAEFHELPGAITLKRGEVPPGKGTIVIAAAGTADLRVAEEAAVCAGIMGNAVDRLYDVGVAGLHRLLAVHDRLTAARVVIVAAGMEGALPSVVGGLVDVPVIAVPTSVGYGSSFGGLTALLAMLNSCASGVSAISTRTFDTETPARP